MKRDRGKIWRQWLRKRDEGREGKDSIEGGVERGILGLVFTKFRILEISYISYVFFAHYTKVATIFSQNHGILYANLYANPRYFAKFCIFCYTMHRS
jgi:hypothetical protein